MMMPGERAIELYQFHILAVQFSGDSRIPVFVEEREFVFDVDLLHAGVVS
jgi:hypothetical protein